MLKYFYKEQESTMKKTGYMLLVLFVMPLFLQAGHKWVVTYAKGTPYTQQGYVVTDRWEKLAYEIKKRWNRGYDIVTLAYGYTQWAAVYAKDTGMREQFGDLLHHSG